MFSLICRDFVWNDSESARALLAFVSASRAIGFQVTWLGPIPEPMVGFFDEENVTLDSSE